MDVLDMNADAGAFDQLHSLLRVISNPKAVEAHLIELRHVLKEVAEARAAIATEREAHDAKMAADRAEVAQATGRAREAEARTMRREEAFKETEKMVAEQAARVTAWEHQHDDGFALSAGSTMTRGPARRFVPDEDVLRLIVANARSIVGDAPEAPPPRETRVERFGATSLSRNVEEEAPAAAMALRPRAAGLHNRA